MRWVKTILIVIAASLLAVVAALYVSYRSLRVRLPESKESRREGAAFGRGKQPQQCIEESLRRAREDNSRTGSIRARVFAKACLEAATPSPAYCAEVPAQIIDTAYWAATECASRGMQRNEGCTQVYTAASDFCHPWL